MPAKAGLQGVLFCPGPRSLARNAMRARSYRFRRRKALSRTTGETASAPRALSREKIWNAAKPSPVSLRSPPSPAVRERGHDAFSTKPLSRTAQGCPGKLPLQGQWVVISHMIPKSSCADLIRASTPLFRLLEAVDGRDEPGQDEVIQPISSLVRPQNFPGQPCAPRERGGQARRAWGARVSGGKHQFDWTTRP